MGTSTINAAIHRDHLHLYDQLKPTRKRNTGKAQRPMALSQVNSGKRKNPT
jgi:hypothetical protein